MKDEQIREMKREIDRLLLDLGEAGVDNKLKSQRLYNAANESSVRTCTCKLFTANSYCVLKHYDEVWMMMS